MRGLRIAAWDDQSKVAQLRRERLTSSWLAMRNDLDGYGYTDIVERHAGESDKGLPVLADLRDGGEQDADVVLFMHSKSSDVAGAERPPDPMVVFLVATRHRSGDVGTRRMPLCKSKRCFVSATAPRSAP